MYRKLLFHAFGMLHVFIPLNSFRRKHLKLQADLGEWDNAIVLKSKHAAQISKFGLADRTRKYQ